MGPSNQYRLIEQPKVSANRIDWLVARDANAVREFQAAHGGVSLAGIAVVADDASVAARLEPVDRPFVHLVTDRRLGKENEAVVGDVEVVGQPQAAVVVDRTPAAVRLVGGLINLAVGRDSVETHAADADIEIVAAVEGHAERLTPDMGEDFHALIIRGEKANDVAVARTGI